MADFAGTLTVDVATEDNQHSALAEILVTGTVNLGDDVAAGGEEVTIEHFNTALATAYKGSASAIEHIQCAPAVDGSILVPWDKANGKLKAIGIADGVEDTGDLSDAGYTVRYLAWLSK